MQKSKVDLGFLLAGSGLSPDVADRIFGGVTNVEVDVLETLATSDPGSLANDVPALHAAIEELLRTAPDTRAMRNFLTLYIAQAQHTAHYLDQLLQQEKGRKHGKDADAEVDQGDC